jgi:hypothetical protein
LNTFAIQLIKTYLPYLVAFLLGVLLAWKGCGNPQGKESVTIDRPIPTIEYVDRWKTDTVRFVDVVIRTDTVRDTVSNEVSYIVTDTVFDVDTVSIVSTWLSEVAKYDTTASFESADVRLTWQNYQNRTEGLMVQLDQKLYPSKFALGVHANVGMISDFSTSYVPLIGIGVQVTVKKTYFSADYGFNGQHYVGLRVGRNIVNL